MKYSISGLVTVSCYTLVEADSEDEALRIAASRDIAEFSIDGSYEVEYCFHIENDGAPYDLKVDT